jgi:hypothetical protein
MRLLCTDVVYSTYRYPKESGYSSASSNGSSRQSSITSKRSNNSASARNADYSGNTRTRRGVAESRSSSRGSVDSRRRQSDEDLLKSMEATISNTKKSRVYEMSIRLSIMVVNNSDSQETQEENGGKANRS